MKQRVNIYMPVILLDRAKVEQSRTGESFSGLVRRLLVEYLDDKGIPSPTFREDHNAENTNDQAGVLDR